MAKSLVQAGVNPPVRHAQKRVVIMDKSISSIEIDGMLPEMVSFQKTKSLKAR